MKLRMLCLVLIGLIVASASVFAQGKKRGDYQVIHEIVWWAIQPQFVPVVR